MKRVSFLLIAFTCITLVSCVKQEQIDELNSKIDSINNNIEIQLNNQTALFYKVIGDSLPVVIPEESQKKLDALLNAVRELPENLNDETLKKSVNLYLDFIKTTVPWVQEAASDDILYSKYSIDYYTILNTFNKNQDVNEVVESLQTFIMTSNDYRDINLVIEKYNYLVDEQNKLYENTVAQLNTTMETAFNNPDITRDELIGILNSVEPYIEEEVLQKNIKKLDDFIDEKENLEQVLDELKSLKSSLEETAEKQYQEQLYNIYAEQLAICHFKLSSIENIKHDEADTLLMECTNKLVAYDNNVKRQQEENFLKQIEESLKMCNEEIEKLSENAISSSMISILATQLASLKFDAETLSIINNAQVLLNIQNSMDKLNAKERELSDKNAVSENTKIKIYNKKALDIIENVKKQNDAIINFMLTPDEKSKKVDLLLQLERIQPNYLYLSIGTLYQQVYQEIWNSLDSQNRFVVSRKSLDIKKDEL